MRSIELATSILMHLADSQRASLTDISRKLGEPKTTVHRMLGAMRNSGWVLKSSDNNWMISGRLFGIAHQLDAHASLLSLARPVMENLRDEADETVHLSIREGDRIILIERVAANHPIQTQGLIGVTNPVWATSAGKAILAMKSDAEIRQIAPGPYPILTERTLSTIDDLMSRIHETRSNGYAVNDGEWHSDVFAAGAAIRGPHGWPDAALSLSMPRARAPRSRWQQLGETVRAAVAELDS